jgi:hypothetical protein
LKNNYKNGKEKKKEKKSNKKSVRGKKKTGNLFSIYKELARSEDFLNFWKRGHRNARMEES